jgi:hypothetical protein
MGRKYRKLRIAWSVGCLAALVVFLPDIEPARGPNSTLVPPSRLIMPMSIGLPLIAALPWIPTRFSLRALLIGMTVVAAVLGLAIWARGS